jgi:thymidine phosphorylase
VRKLLVIMAVVVCAPACAAAKDKVQQAVPRATTTTAPVLPDGQCVARMKDASPPQGGTETVIVDSHFPSATAAITVHYKSTNSNYSAQLDANKHAEAQFSIGHPTSNFPVKVDVNVNQQESCTTSFVPR